MLPLISLLMLLISFSAIVLGCASNSWTVHVNIMEWRSGLRLSPSDQILSFIAAINIPLQIMLSLDMSLVNALPVKSYASSHLVLINIGVFLVSCNLWVTTLLGSYYCLKIVNFSKGILLALKMKIPGLVPKLLVASVGLSFCIAMPSNWNIYIDCDQGSTGNSTRDSTEDICSLGIREAYLIAAFVGLILPLLLTLVPIGVTLASLWRHTRRIKKNKTDSCHPQTQAHVRAAQTMILLVTLHMAFYGAVFSFFLKSFNVDGAAMFFSWFFCLVLPHDAVFCHNNGECKTLESMQKNLQLKRHPVQWAGDCPQVACYRAH
ncbi:taste receptor type 2 member 140-like [Aquarana catesbeiana]|uniref:taste receptor type 2 member 140-like n=1 Tax=Aquarana catesbeiana TaxID=8400 RepID=UPI003CCA1537